ncbi:MAG TPA: carboxymuconolactone decarboxylase family protein [Acidobacteriota bacterium]
MESRKPWFLHQSPLLGSSYLHFKTSVVEKSVLEPKTRELIMVALSSMLRCPHCTEEHLKGALAAGATKQEIAETLLVTAFEGAGTQLSWQKETFEKYLGANAE